ncbi:MAG: Lrp/AsnC family transcriptional regulator [Gammaproteobacteria bacterium]|nr:Lrp/AsnC family transcriptional regulator [Gammaproteobacteria bacterium]
MDSIDKKILQQLQSNGEQSVSEIADICGLSKSACWRRIQKLEELGVIKERTVLLNARALGLKLTVYISIRTNQHNTEWATRFKEITDGLENILEVHRMSGDLDYLIKAVVRDMQDYDHLYQRLIRADLYDVSASFVMEELKVTTHLPLDS